MKTQLITLTTDFGEGSPYVAQMKAVILTIHPQATLIDITHSISPQDIRYGALVLDDVAPRFPAATMHVCVVDPGVGTGRKIVYAGIGDQQFIAPDNGLLSLVARRFPTSDVIAVESRRYWREPVSSTFHGRDILAPVAAHVSRGVAPGQLGPRHSDLVQLSWPAVWSSARSLTGAVLAVDHFGNLVTNITRAMISPELPCQDVRVACGGHACDALVQTYGDATPGQLVALFGSADRLEIAVTNGSAAQRLGVEANTPVRVSW